MMPTFAHPEWLLALVLVPPLLWRWRRQGTAALRFPAAGEWATPRGRSLWAQRGGLLLRGVGLVCLVAALAGPRWPDLGSRVPTESLAISMVVDVSASMSDRDFLWQNQVLSRLEGVKKVFRLFVEGGTLPDGATLEPRPYDLLGLTVFATRPEPVCPLTLDHAALLKLLDAQEARTLATEAHSNPGDALALALASLHQAPARRKILILLTDGESNVPPPALTPRQAAQLAGNLGVPIYAIDAGNEFAEVKEEADKGTSKASASLKEVARLSKGRYFQANDGYSLAQACAEIDRLERDRVQSHQFRRWYEGWVWFALASLAAWFSVVTLESTVWRRIP